MSGGAGGAVAEGEGTRAAIAGGVGSGGVGVEVTPMEDSAASTRRPRPASPPGFLSVPLFPPRSSLRPVAVEPRVFLQGYWRHWLCRWWRVSSGWRVRRGSSLRGHSSSSSSTSSRSSSRSSSSSSSSSSNSSSSSSNNNSSRSSNRSSSSNNNSSKSSLSRSVRRG
ncbi:unnamed protein product [Closterium sp. NIES-54]